MWLLLACSPAPGTAAGRLVDARGGGGVADTDVLLTPDRAECAPVHTRTDTDGRWAAADLCAGATWTVTPGAPDWYTPEPPVATADGTLQVWPAPADVGVYTVVDGVATRLGTHTGLDVARVFDTDDEVRFPLEIPDTVPRIAPGTTLLLVGAPVGATPVFAPVIPSVERRWFGSKAAPRPIDPWVYLGARFGSDTEWERVDTPLDPAATEQVGGPRPLLYVEAGALTPGRYALPTADATRAFLLDFGALP